MSNLINNLSELKKFSDDRLRFIVSSRRITPDVSIMDYLKVHYIFIKPTQIKQVFGNVIAKSRLYGGRTYEPYHSMTENHIKELYDNNIGVSLNLTNHFFDKESYKESLNILEKYHSSKNSVIITNDELAKQIRCDFPDYELKASIIKNISSISRLEKALELYDYITLPMDLNDNDDFLKNISQKDKIILFANANCAYTCPSRTCYYGFSQQNRGEKVTSVCSKNTMWRLDRGPVYFDVKKLADMGFSLFKLVPLFFEEADRVTKQFSWKKKSDSSYYKKPNALIVSYPKSGRTWLRFIMANYLNLLHGLNLEIDLHNFFHLLPNDTEDDIKGIRGFKYYNNQDIPLYLFSHKKRDEIKYNGKFVFIIRSPYDTLVSDYFQQTEHLGIYKGSIKEFIRDEKTGINKLCNFYNSWESVLLSKNTFVMSYEEMTNDILLVTENLFSYINIDVDKKNLLFSINCSSFNNMQFLEKETGFLSEKTYDRNTNNALRMCEGKTNIYNKYLDNEDIEFIKQAINSKLSKKLIPLLNKHKSL